jgi:ZIP family zinc transporter/zinc and cadmium transporter
MSPIGISVLLAGLAGAANLLGSAIVLVRPWSRPLLSYFIALGSGFMLATAMTAMVPEALRLAPVSAPFLILVGYLIVHYFEHTLPGHFHFGEETHRDEFLNPSVAYTALAGLVIHTFFGGVSLASGFLVSRWLGAVIFGAIILHNVPEGFTIASIMVAADKGRQAGYWAAGALAFSRILGALAMGLMQHWVSYGLALSAGATLYVAASDLIPEVNKLRGSRIALTVAVGVGLVFLMQFLFGGHAGH